ncbi:MAG TPA: cupin domain-containing protein [Reyranella sp.]|jgi:uncharacterized protein YjlB
MSGAARPDLTSPQLYRFEDDGKTPNNPRLPLILYRNVLQAPAGGDRAAVCEDLFARHGWANGWRNGIYPFLHFHTRTHEVLGIAQGTARVEFGGDKGQTLDVQAGDVVALPAGTGHRRVSSSADLLVIGAYPTSGSSFDQARPNEIDLQQARQNIANVGRPAQDPVYGKDGPLTRLWADR